MPARTVHEIKGMLLARGYESAEVVRYMRNDMVRMRHARRNHTIYPWGPGEGDDSLWFDATFPPLEGSPAWAVRLVSWHSQR